MKRIVLLLLVVLGPGARAAPRDRGVCYAHTWRHGGSAGYGTETSARTVDHLQSLGVNALSLMPFGFMPSAASPTIVSLAHPSGETDDRLCAEIRAAHARGMRVTLKPNIWIAGDSWPGALAWKDDAAFAAWFASLREMALRYARLAADEDVDVYLFATELKSATLRDPAAFRRLVAELRAIYPRRGHSGQLGYAANWDEAETVSFWDALDVVGVDLYAPLSTLLHPSDAELAIGAQRIATTLGALAARVRKRIVLAEVGYRAAVGTALAPSLWPEHDSAAYDPLAQAQCWSAVLGALWNQPWLEGLYAWKWFTDGKDEHGPIDYSLAGKPAEAVLRDWFQRR
jgi:hypothetical protein